MAIMKLSAIAAALGATLENVSGELDIERVAGIESAGPHDITFVSNAKYQHLLKETKAGAVLVSPKLEAPAGLPLVRVANPYLAFAQSISLFYQAPVYAPGVHPSAVVDPSAKIGEGVHIGPLAVVDADAVIGAGSVILSHAVIYRGAHLGARCFIHAHAVVREFCQLGDDVVLQNGVIIGGDGFGFANDGSGWRKIVQSGVTILENGVEVQSNATIDRASIGETRVGAGAKVDNLVQIGHGSTVGARTMLCSQVGLAGSTHVGSDVILAGQVGVAGHLKIGDGVIATAQTGIPGDVAAKSVVSGYPAIDNRQWLKCSAAFTKLPDLIKQVRRLARMVEGDKSEE